MAICMAIAMLCGAAHAEKLLCINVPGVVALTDYAGNERIENGRFDELFTVREGSLYAAGERGAYRLYDAHGRAVGDTAFSMIDDEGDALVYRAGGLYGAMSASGELLLSPQWTQLTSDGAGGWLALDDDPLDEQPDELIHIDANGEQRRTGVMTASGLERVSGGRMPFLDADGRWGAVNGEGVVTIEPLWRYMGPFDRGVARVTGPNGVGMIDSGGKAVVAARYKWLETGPSMTAAWDGEGIDVYPPRGGPRRFRLPGAILEIAMVGSALSVTREDGVSLYDSVGALLFKGSAGTVYSQGSRGRFVASDGEWGEKCQWVLNSDGSTSSVRFQQLLPLLGDRYAFLEMDGIEYYSEELGRLQKSWDYSDRLYGLADGTGRILLPAEYREIQALSEDRILLIENGTVTLADRNGAAIRAWDTPETEEPIGEAGE